MKKQEETTLRALAQDLEMHLQIIRARMRRRLKAEYARGEITGPQRLVMQALVEAEAMHESGAISLKQLSAKVGLAHSTVSGIVHRLEKRGFIDRQVSESDRRLTQLKISKAVRDFLKKKAPELALHPLLKALQRASESERTTIRKGIETLERLLVE